MEHTWLESQWKAPKVEIGEVEQGGYYTLGERYIDDYVPNIMDMTNGGTSDVGGGQPRDEIAEFQDLRSIGSSEAVWRLLSFPIADRYPVVIALRVHTEEQQMIVFDEETEVEALETQRETELTAFFKYSDFSTYSDIFLIP